MPRSRPSGTRAGGRRSGVPGFGCRTSGQRADHCGSVSWSSISAAYSSIACCHASRAAAGTNFALLRDDPARLAKDVDDLRRDARLLHRLGDRGVVLVIGRDVEEDRIIRTRLPPIARNELLALALPNLAHLGADR